MGVARYYCRASINIVRPRCCGATFIRPFVLSCPPSAFLATPPPRRGLSRVSDTPFLAKSSPFANRRTFATMGVEVPYVTLNDGNKMPQVGFGLWKVDNATCADQVYNAIKTGYRLFDGACGMSVDFSFHPSCHLVFSCFCRTRNFKASRILRNCVTAQPRSDGPQGHVFQDAVDIVV